MPEDVVDDTTGYPRAVNAELLATDDTPTNPVVADNPFHAIVNLSGTSYAL